MSYNWLNFSTLRAPSTTNPSEISKLFIEQYYRVYDTEWKTLYNYYTDTASLTFQNEELGGVQAIRTKYESLQFTNPVHKSYLCNAQFIDKDKVLIMATGCFSQTVGGLFGQETKNFNYVETFVIVCNSATGKWFIQNHVFRLV